MRAVSLFMLVFCNFIDVSVVWGSEEYVPPQYRFFSQGGVFTKMTVRAPKTKNAKAACSFANEAHHVFAHSQDLKKSGIYLLAKRRLDSKNFFLYFNGACFCMAERYREYWIESQALLANPNGTNLPQHAVNIYYKTKNVIAFDKVDCTGFKQGVYYWKKDGLWHHATDGDNNKFSATIEQLASDFTSLTSEKDQKSLKFLVNMTGDATHKGLPDEVFHKLIELFIPKQSDKEENEKIQTGSEKQICADFLQFIEIAGARLTNLQTLKLTDGVTPEIVLKVTAAFKKLASLTLTNGKIDRPGIVAIGSLQNLKHLDISGNNLGELFNVLSAFSLETLVATNNNLENSHVENFSFGSLIKLDLSDNKQLGKFSWMRHVKRLTSGGIGSSQMFSQCSKLQELYFRNTNAGSGDAKAFAALPSLKILDLSGSQIGWHGITDALDVLAQKNIEGKQLIVEELDFRGGASKGLEYVTWGSYGSIESQWKAFEEKAQKANVALTYSMSDESK